MWSRAPSSTKAPIAKPSLAVSSLRPGWRSRPAPRWPPGPAAAAAGHRAGSRPARSSVEDFLSAPAPAPAPAPTRRWLRWHPRPGGGCTLGSSLSPRTAPSRPRPAMPGASGRPSRGECVGDARVLRRRRVRGSAAGRSAFAPAGLSAKRRLEKLESSLGGHPHARPQSVVKVARYCCRARKYGRAVEGVLSARPPQLAAPRATRRTAAPCRLAILEAGEPRRRQPVTALGTRARVRSGSTLSDWIREVSCHRSAPTPAGIRAARRRRGRGAGRRGGTRARRSARDDAGRTRGLPVVRVPAGAAPDAEPSLPALPAAHRRPPHGRPAHPPDRVGRGGVRGRAATRAGPADVDCRPPAVAAAGEEREGAGRPGGRSLPRRLSRRTWCAHRGRSTSPRPSVP